MEAIPMIIMALSLTCTDNESVDIDEPSPYHQTDIGREEREPFQVFQGNLLKQHAEEPEVSEDVLEDSEGQGQ